MNVRRGFLHALLAGFLLAQSVAAAWAAPAMALAHARHAAAAAQQAMPCHDGDVQVDTGDCCDQPVSCDCAGLCAGTSVPAADAEFSLRPDPRSHTLIPTAPLAAAHRLGLIRPPNGKS